MNSSFRKTGALRLGFIGGGINSAVGRAHFSACHMDGLYTLRTGCFSRNQEMNLQSAGQYGVDIEHARSSYRELIEQERENLDAVVILTPTPDHIQPLLSALEVGLPVICEKAMVATVRDAEAVRKVEHERRGFLAISYNYTGYPALRELRAMVTAGRLGKILHLVAEMPQEGFLRCDSRGRPFQHQAWRLNDGPIPGVYLDLGVHLHQLVQYVTALRPTSVSAYHASFGTFSNVVDYVSASVKYTGDVHATYAFGKSMLGHRNGLRIRIYGNEASAEWKQTNPEELRIFHKNGVVEILDRSGDAPIASQRRYTRFKAGHPAGYIEAFANVYADIYGCLQQFLSEGQWQSMEVFGSETAERGLKFMNAMCESASSGTHVQILD